MALLDGDDVVSKKVFLTISISAILLAGCMHPMATPAAQSAVTSETPTVISIEPSSADSQNDVKSIALQIGSKQVSLTLVQNNKVVPIAVQDSKHGAVTLAPDTFTIRLEGDKEYTYIAGQTDQTLLLAMESYKRPLATFDAGYPVLENNDLRIFDPSLDFTADLESFFAKSWGSPEHGQQIVNDLKGAFGTKPVIIYGGFALLESPFEESGYTIKTVKGIKPTSGKALFVTIFLRDNIVGEFDQLAWFTFHISFVAQ